MIRHALLTSLTAVCLLAQHEQKEKEKSQHPAIGDPVAIEAGRKLFLNGCAGCHGADGKGGRGPNLRERGMWHPMTDETLYSTIHNGIPGGMPPANLPEEQEWQIVAYVRSLTSPAVETPVEGNPEEGRRIFWSKQAGCSNCHRILGQGGLLGPDLSNVGGVRSLPHIRESILDPDEEIPPGYRSASVVLRNGRRLEGIARNFSNYSLQLQDQQGHLHLIPMEDVERIDLARGSAMPKDYAKRLTNGELRDLLAFLAQQSVRPVELTKRSKADK